MKDIKRVLWVDDRPQNRAGSMFDVEETKNVSTMDEALKEIAGSHLYEYDTIVLDIDFEDGLKNSEEVIKKLIEKIYLNRDQQNTQFVINNGGYLLFLYLLEKGYPSEQVAFLTGNGPMIQKLREYNLQNANPMSRDEIADKLIQIWNHLEDDDDKYDNFAIEVEKLPIAVEYTDDDFVNDCIDLLDVDEDESIDEAAFRKRIYQVEVRTVTSNAENTGDMMIYRFHEANLKAPMYFSKNDNDIRGHNRSDAQNWLNERRTLKNVSRWLILSAANRIEQLFRDTDKNMTGNIRDIFREVNGDGGVRNAYRQMFFVLDGLRSKAADGAYYQAISAMLMPFDASPKKCGNTAAEAVYKNARGENRRITEDEQIRRMFSSCTKQARNYCAHNSFGSTLDEKTSLFLLLISTTSVLCEEERKQFYFWYQKAEEAINQKKVNGTDTINKVNDLIQRFVQNDEIDFEKARVDKNYQNYSTRDKLVVMGYHIPMTKEAPAVREAYYLFTLAAYIVLWFDGMNGSDVREKFGKEVEIIYNIAQKIVTEYTYLN